MFNFSCCLRTTHLANHYKNLAFIVEIDDDMFMRYPGGKGKCFHQIINLMPRHHTYIEPFLGGGAVMRNKKPAERNIGIDLDPRVFDMWQQISHPGMELIHADAVSYLSSFNFDGGELVYIDPPYLPSTRRKQRIYRFEYNDEQHINLLKLANSLPCLVMISGYDNSLYDQHLDKWNKSKFFVNSHAGRREECVWFNFAHAEALHDTTYLGETFRDRQSVKRRRGRLHERIERMDAVERSDLMEWMIATYGEDRTM
ncbi:DNA adenine methylase [Undibacterium sp. TJN19]|uniref:DNA adenine methylase n=1 Tax=Undibacterium sp. TJN19 TaxID=3413055 RepID=UPI003BF23B57